MAQPPEADPPGPPDPMPDPPADPSREETRALELTGPRDAVPEDPSASIAAPDFPFGLRGYDRAAVDAYVQRVVRLVDELDAVRSPRAAVRQALDRVGTETSGILAQAHATADGVTMASRREAEALTSSSRRDAEDRLERARAEAAEIVRDAQERAQALDRDADVIWQDRARLLADVARIEADLRRVVQTAGERFPPEADADAAGERFPPEAHADAAGERFPPEAHADAAGEQLPREADADAAEPPPRTPEPEADTAEVPAQPAVAGERLAPEAETVGEVPKSPSRPDTPPT